MKKLIIFLILLAISLVIVLSTQKTITKPQLGTNTETLKSTSILSSSPWVPLLQFEKYKESFDDSLINTDIKEEFKKELKKEFKEEFIDEIEKESDMTIE